MDEMRATLGDWKQTVKELMEANQKLSLENEQLRIILKREAPLDKAALSAEAEAILVRRRQRRGCRRRLR